MTLVDTGRGWPADRDQFENWLIRKGLTYDQSKQVIRLVVRPGSDKAVAVYPWSEDRGQLYRDIPLATNEVVWLEPDKRKPDATWLRALEFPCGSCKSRPGDWCVSRDGRPVPRIGLPHRRRMGQSGDPLNAIWERALRVPCDRCGSGVGEICTTLPSGADVLLGNGPHEARRSRTDHPGSYAWAVTRRRYGPNLLPGPSPDGVIEDAQAARQG